MTKEYNNFKLHKINGHIQNIYIVEYPDKLLLLDGACRSDTPVIIKFITNTLKRNISDLKLTVASHIHPDHIGASLVLRKKYRIPIVAHKNIDKCYKGFGGFFQHKVNIFLAWFVVLKTKKPPKRIWHKRFAKANYKLTDNDKLPFFEDWKVIYTPGHTGADISLFNTEHKLIYVGDVVVNIGGRLLLPFPISFPKAMEKTMSKLSETDISEVLLAHGKANKNIDFSKLFIKLSGMIYNRPKGYFKLISKFVRLTKYIRKNQDADLI